MRRMQGFQAALIRPLRRLCHPCRHLGAAATTAVVGGTPDVFAPNRTHSRAITTTSTTTNFPSAHTHAEPEQLGETWSAERKEDGGNQAALPSLGAAHTSAGSSSNNNSNTTQTPPLTLELIDAFVKRHNRLCSNLFLFASSPSLAATYAATGSLFVPTAKKELRDGARLDATVRDGEQRHSSRAFHATHAEVREICTVLDRLSQESHILGALTDRQRHRLVMDVCRIGYVVGLHRRSCALFVDAVLRPTATSFSGSPPSPSGTATHGAGTEAALLAIPEFVMDAAGEAADLTTLEHCLAYAARAMRTEGDEMGPGWLAALNVFVQCVRVALQHGWQGPVAATSREAAATACREKTSGGASTGSAESSSELTERVDAAAPPPEDSSALPEGNTSSSSIGTDVEVAPVRNVPHTGDQDDGEEARWHHFTLRVLQLLRIHTAEQFYRATLRRARYRYADAGGDWAAAQAMVYACCFRCWLGEEKEEEGRERYHIAPATARRSKDRSGAIPVMRSPASPQAQPSVLLSCPALVLLLRTAVAARQHDVAEWATLYVDTSIDAWISSERPSEASPSAPQSSSSSTAQLDTLLVWYLRYLQQSGQRHRACRWLRRLRTFQERSPLLSGALHAPPVLCAAARIAGEVLDADLALWCLQQCLSDAPGLRSTHADIFVCLCAVARCGLPTFDMVLQSLQGNGLLHATAEELLYVRLLHTRRTVQWRTAWEACMAPYVVTRETRDASGAVMTRLHLRVDAREAIAGGATTTTTTAARQPSQGTEQEEEDGEHFSAQAATSAQLPPSSSSSTSVFTPRVMHQVLLLLQEGDHALFMSYYRTFLATFSEHVTVDERARWAVLALAWTTAQQDRAPLADVVYVVREVDQLMALQAGHMKGKKRREMQSSSSSSLPPPIAEDLHRSLQRRWATLYQQHAPEWWANLSGGVADAHGVVLGIEVVLMQRMAAAARATAATLPTPAVARFARRRHRLPVADVAAVDMFVSSVRDGAAGVSSSTQLLRSAAALHQHDRELWAAYVASAKKVV